MVIALADLGGELLICLAILILFCCYLALYWARSFAPHWQILGQGIDMRPWLDGPLRGIESLMRYLEGIAVQDAKTVWTLTQETFQLFAELANLAKTDVIMPAVTTVTDDLAKVGAALGHEIQGINATLYHGEAALANAVPKAVHDIEGINSEIGKLWHAVQAVNVMAVEHELAKLANIPADVQALEHKLTAVTAVLTPVVLRDLPDLAKLARELGKITALPAEVERIAAKVGAIEGTLQGIPHDIGADLAHLGELVKLLDWARPLIAVGAISTALVEAWRLLRDGECPCDIPVLPSSSAVQDFLLADLIMKDGI